MKTIDTELLKQLCTIHAPSGNESKMKAFLMDYVQKNASRWRCMPEIIEGDIFQDCILLKFGKPRTAVFAHMDSVGFTVRYEDQLIPIGGPEAQTGYLLEGEDELGPIRCELRINEEGQMRYYFPRPIARGTDLVFLSDFRETEEYVQSCYMDNRLGVYNALKIAENLEDGLLVFSCWEEHGGGTVPYLAKFIYETYAVKQALISDITWVTDGVHHGSGTVISLRDRNIPRKAYLDKIIEVAKDSGIAYQLEVEAGGSSDGRELQEAPYPFDWCFIGAPESHVHSPNEKVHKSDIISMQSLYEVLMKEL